MKYKIPIWSGVKVEKMAEKEILKPRTHTLKS